MLPSIINRCYNSHLKDREELYDRNEPVKVIDIWDGRNIICCNNRFVYIHIFAYD
jgi:hypothetical protein